MVVVDLMGEGDHCTPSVVCVGSGALPCLTRASLPSHLTRPAPLVAVPGVGQGEYATAVSALDSHTLLLGTCHGTLAVLRLEETGLREVQRCVGVTAPPSSRARLPLAA